MENQRVLSDVTITELRNMKLHDEIRLGTVGILRVPTGWIYDIMVADDLWQTTFVPF